MVCAGDAMQSLGIVVWYHITDNQKTLIVMVGGNQTTPVLGGESVTVAMA